MENLYLTVCDLYDVGFGNTFEGLQNVLLAFNKAYHEGLITMDEYINLQNYVM